MKNYEIKSAEELNGAKQSGNRIAFLVLNMYRRVSNGYLKHLPTKTVVETPVQEEIPVQPVQEVAPVVEETPVVENVQNVQPVQTEKPYSLKKFTNNSTITDNNPRRLLISSVFLQKLFTNVKAKVVSVQQVAEEVKTGETALEDAINRYHELMDERTNHIQEIKSIEQELTELVQKYKLTQEQVSVRAKVA